MSQCENESYILTWLRAQPHSAGKNPVVTGITTNNLYFILCLIFFQNYLFMLTGGHSACYVVPLTAVVQN